MQGRLISSLLMLALLVSACGTRVPEEEFRLLMEGTGGSGSSTTPGAGDGGLAVDEGALAGDPDGAAAGASAGDSGDVVGDGGAGGQASSQGDGSGGSVSSGGGDQGGDSDQGGQGGSSTQPNEASDIGVTEDSITVGNLVSLNGPLGRNAFGPSYFGANAYFTYLNQAKGGVHGRTVEFEMCDDAEDPSRNISCAQSLVEDQEVFAFVANSTRAYAGAEYVSDQGVPDILGQPIGNEYWQYPTLYAVRGSEYEQDGSIGYDGKIWGGTFPYRWLKEERDVDTAAVFYFNVPISKAAGKHFANSLRHEDYEVMEFEINPVAQNFASTIEPMRQAGVNFIADTMDVNANRNLCRAMDNNEFQVDVKLTTTQGMSRGVKDYSHPCRESVVALSEALPYSEDSNEEVALFQDVMSRVYGGEFDEELAQWAWEGWLAARSFTAAVESMGPSPTREGLMTYYDELDDYTSGGLFSPLEWTAVDFGSSQRLEQCIVLSQWNEQQADFERISPFPLCDMSTYLPWEPA